ncbi:hypothetical protein [Bowdeniella nasicola]|uniref:hypothetical protein n=1 Tax=Bowdeniella nasicola TaxID=208480 RepID=UPI001FE4B1CF|nr:hypothetical protein [Bowdeniella nasicola]
MARHEPGDLGHELHREQNGEADANAALIGRTEGPHLMGDLVDPLEDGAALVV